MTVLFRVAVGPRLGFGHLVRCRSLARALGVAPKVSVRGSNETRKAAASNGFEICIGGISLLDEPTRPDVLIVDDPSTTQASRWVRRARRLGVPVATLHDLGLGYVESDLPIDGSIDPFDFAQGKPADGMQRLSGPMYAVLDPSIAVVRERPATPRHGVLVALGGGRHVHRWGELISRAILARNPDVMIRIVTGFTDGTHEQDDPRVAWIAAPDGLAAELRRAAVAVVAGGLTIYEAAALGTPAVGLAVVPAQQSTIRGFARRGAAFDAGLAPDAGAIVRAANAVADLLSHPSRAAALGGTAARLVDGRGVFRAADAIRQLAQRLEGHIHAA